MKGYGVKQDYNKAREYFEKSADKKDPFALFDLGILYFNGYGVKKDYNKAIYYFEKSSEEGHSKASYNLGTIYLKGYGVKQDHNKSMKYYEKSLKQGNIIASFRLSNYSDYFYLLRNISKYWIGIHKNINLVNYFQDCLQNHYPEL